VPLNGQRGGQADKGRLGGGHVLNPTHKADPKTIRQEMNLEDRRSSR